MSQTWFTGTMRRWRLYRPWSRQAGRGLDVDGMAANGDNGTVLMPVDIPAYGPGRVAPPATRSRGWRVAAVTQDHLGRHPELHGKGCRLKCRALSAGSYSRWVLLRMTVSRRVPWGRRGWSLEPCSRGVPCGSVRRGGEEGVVLASGCMWTSRVCRGASGTFPMAAESWSSKCSMPPGRYHRKQLASGRGAVRNSAYRQKCRLIKPKTSQPLHLDSLYLVYTV